MLARCEDYQNYVLPDAKITKTVCKDYQNCMNSLAHNLPHFSGGELSSGVLHVTIPDVRSTNYV